MTNPTNTTTAELSTMRGALLTERLDAIDHELRCMIASGDFDEAFYDDLEDHYLDLLAERDELEPSAPIAIFADQDHMSG